MEKYKTIILIEKIKKCLEDGKCEEALSIAEAIDKKKIKNLSDLSIVAECYFQNLKYEEAKKLFLRMYDKNRSRRIVAQLVHLSIKLKDVEEANSYLSEFIEIAPKDFYRYIFQYSIDKMTKAPIVKLIEDLEALKKTEYIESWAYELAKLYHKASLKDKCLAECNDIILWFGDGDYVERAKALKAYYLGELDVSVYNTSEDSVTKPMETDKNEEVRDSVTTQYEESAASEVAQEEEFRDSVTTQYEESAASEALRDEEITDDVTAQYEENVASEVAQDEEIADSETEQNEENVGSEAIENEEIIYREAVDSETATTMIERNNEPDTCSYNTVIDEIDISAKLAREIDVIFNQDKCLDNDSHLDKEEDVVQQVNQENEEIQSQEKDNSKYLDVEQEVEEELYRLLREEGIESNPGAKTVSNPDTNSASDYDTNTVNDSDAITSSNSDEKTISSSGTIAVNKVEEQTTETTTKKQIQKIHLKQISNDHIVEEEGLLHYFEHYDISLSDLFGNFIRMDATQKQLIRSLDQALTQKNNINLIITGEKKSGKTRLARCIAKTLNRMNLIQSKKIALIDGVKLNSVDWSSIKEQLSGCVLIIERAGMMSKDTVKLLQKLIQDLPNHIIIMLEDTRENINRLLRANSALNGIFNNRVHLHKYSLEDYMGFAYDYLTEKEYEIEMEAFIALQNEFSALIKKDRENALPAIFSTLDTIIQKSEKRNAVLLKEMSQSGRFEESDFMVLKRNDIL